jgi:16S rRNA (cytosine967-C5)-methyltransferase
VLVDAPCTGIGALRRNPDARRRLTEENVAEHASRQLAIVRRMSALVRKGGLLVYATCSVLRREDEAVVSAFLAEGAPFAPVSPRELLGAELTGALDEAVRDGSPGLRSADALRVWPHRHGTDGFFAAALRRV